MTKTFPLITSDWLNSHLNDGNLFVLDASMDTVVGKEPLIYDSFLCIKGSQKCDIERTFHNKSSSQSHTMPTPEQFTCEVQRLGVNFDSIVVIYDNQGIYCAPRAWWMFKVMGFENVYVLDGGLPEWLEKGFPTEDRFSLKERGSFVANYQHSAICDADSVVGAINSHENKIVDARASARFTGKAPEPRASLRSGHIPSSINIPFLDLLRGFRYKSVEELRLIFLQQEVYGESLICSCGSGITACVVILAATMIGAKDLCLYDGSWSEWGENSDLPIER